MWGSGYGMMNGAWGGWSGPLFMVLGLGLFIGVLFVLSRVVARGGHPAHGKAALDVLEERYARGEINRAEFQEKRADIAKH